ncbi:MAG TPA: type II toxin-antitoxin system VapC family toxin [Armatimonadota bacterium]
MVVDASVALAWAFDLEANEYTDRVLVQAETEGMLVPSLFHLEVGNVLNVALKHRRTTEARVAAFLGDLARLQVRVDLHTHERALSDTLMLARAHGLTVYDAAYLELTLREGRLLATQDGPLSAAADHLGCRYL